MKAQRELKKDPKRAVEIIEKVLEDEPDNRQANLVLKQAALAAGWLEIGVFALQTLLEEKARDTKILHELGRVYRELGESDKEVEIYNRIAEIDPLDAQAARLGKDASARASMKTGGWTQAESYRDLIKDKEAAVSFLWSNRAGWCWPTSLSNSKSRRLSRVIKRSRTASISRGKTEYGKVE
jgi:tetratricopeptide (TPR) repeat protein